MHERLSSKRAAILAAFCFFIGVSACSFILFSFSQSPLYSASLEKKFEKLEIITSRGEQKFRVEIARTPAEQATGLMFRRDLLPDQGMLFIYERSKEISMWMRNTYISLDMIFVKADGTVHRIEEKTEPLSEDVISSHGLVLGVLEVPAGTAQTLSLKPGDSIRHPLFKKK